MYSTILIKSTIGMWRNRPLKNVRGGQFLFVEYLFESLSSPFRDDSGSLHLWDQLDHMSTIPVNNNVDYVQLVHFV